MSECFLSRRGQGHVSNFYILDLENFATASRRYTGDIHNSTVVGLFMTPIRQWKRHGWVHMFITQCPHYNLQLHNFDLFRTRRTSSLCTCVGDWQDFNWYYASRGPSAIAELLVWTRVHVHTTRLITITWLNNDNYICLISNWIRSLLVRTRSSAIAEGPRDASCQLKSFQQPRNTAETTYTTSPDQIDGMKLDI